MSYQVAETGQSGVVSFPPNAGSASFSVTIPVDQDLLDNTLHVQLSNPTGGSASGCGDAGGACVNLGQSALSILVDDETVAIAVGLGGGDAILVREDSELGVPVTRSSSTGSIRVDYELVGQTAGIPRDFEPLPPTQASGSVVFPEGDASPQELRIAIKRDADQDDGETFLVRIAGTTVLSGNVAVPSPTAQVTVTIENRTPTIAFARAGSTADEGQVVEVQVVRQGEPSFDIRAQVSRVGGNADDQDYRILDPQIRLRPGEMSTTARVQILEDSRSEEEKLLLLGLSSGHATIGGGGQYRLVLAENVGAERLEISGDAPEETASFGESMVFKTRVLGGDNQPVSGVVIEWSIAPASAGTFKDGSSLSAPTGADGIATKEVVFGTSVASVVVTARVQGDPETQLTFSAVAVQGEVISDNIPKPPGSVAAGVDALCQDPEQFQNNGICGYFASLRDREDLQNEALQEISGGDLTQTVDEAMSGVRAQLENIASRLATLRGGASRQATQQIAMSIQGKSFDPVSIARAVTEPSSVERLNRGLGRSFERFLWSASGGTENLAESSSASGTAPQEASFDRWGFFVNGRASFGDSPALGTEQGFKFETEGLSAGADYRFDSRFALGAALGFAKSESTLDGNGGSLNSDGRSFTLFGLFTPAAKPVYVQAIASFGQNDFASLRRIDLPQAEGSDRYNEAAFGDSDGDQLSLAAELGVERQVGRGNLAGFGRLSYTTGNVGGYRERGESSDQIGGVFYGPAFHFEVGDQDFKSLLSQIGLDLSRAFSTSCCGVLVPAVRVAYLHEFEEDSRRIPVRLNVVGNTFDPALTEFVVVTNDPDRDYFTLGIGAQALTQIGQFYLFLDSEQQRSELETWSVSFGYRKEF